MSESFHYNKLKIALHSFGAIAICLTLFLLSLIYAPLSPGKYALIGALTGAILSRIFTKTNYLIAVQKLNDKIIVHYLSHDLFRKTMEFNTAEVEITFIKGTNWWFGENDCLVLTTPKQSHKYVLIDRKLKQTVKEQLGIE